METFSRDDVVRSVRYYKTIFDWDFTIDEKDYANGMKVFIPIAIDKPEGVTHGDCELVSHQVGTILDVEDVVPGGRYTLEVSSPGIERKLLKPQDYQRFQGKKAKITLRDAVEGRRNWEGMLAGFSGGAVSLETEPGKTRQFPLEQVQKANLKFEW